jgi:hypothetical protein
MTSLRNPVGHDPRTSMYVTGLHTGAQATSNTRITSDMLPNQQEKQKRIFRFLCLPIAVAARSKARTVFARSNTEIVGSNPT